MKAKYIYFLLPFYHFLDSTLKILIVPLFSYIPFYMISLLISCLFSLSSGNSIIWRSQWDTLAMTVADCNLLVILRIRWKNQDVKMFWNFCPHIKSHAWHSTARCFSATFFVYLCYHSPTGKNSLISSKMKLNQFISGILFAWDWSQ